MTWVVVARKGRYWGQVGVVSTAQWKESTMFDDVEVQFGNSGPFATMQKSSLFSVSRLVRDVEERQGCRFMVEETEA